MNMRIPPVKKVFIFLTSALALLSFCLLPHGCANTTAGPSGGPKDTLPPRLLVTIPDVNQTGVSTSLKRVELQFNEYVKLEKPNDNILLSPPHEKNPTVRTKGKGIVVDLQEALYPNTTYSLYFGNAIQDNNEGNPFPVFALSFSTGERLDSLMISGLVSDASTLLPVQNATVLLHINPTDSTLTSTLPVAATRTDTYGYFVLRNLKDTLYSLYTITDQNNNYLYNRESGELIGFLDSLVKPEKTMFTYAPEIQPYYAKDTAGLLRRPVEKNVFVFKETPYRQRLSQHERMQHRALSLSFTAPGAQILKTYISQIDSAHIVTQHNYRRDSLVLWLTAPAVPDTVLLHLTYMATDDSLETLAPRTDTLRFSPFQKEEKDTPVLGAREGPGSGRTDNQQGPPSVREKKEAMELTSKVVQELIREKGVSLRFESLPLNPDFSKATLTRITPSEDTVAVPYTVLRDSLDLCLYNLIPNTYVEGTRYILTLPEGLLTDINGLQNDSITVPFKTLLSEDYGALHLQLQNVPCPLIVDVMNERRDQIIRTSRAFTDTTLTFPYLREGKFTIRVTEDRNGNGFWDTGNLKEKRQAERVRMFRLPSGSSIIELKDKMELSQTIDIEQLLNQNVTLSVPARQR